MQYDGQSSHVGLNPTFFIFLNQHKTGGKLVFKLVDYWNNTSSVVVYTQVETRYSAGVQRSQRYSNTTQTNNPERNTHQNPARQRGYGRLWNCFTFITCEKWKSTGW